MYNLLSKREHTIFSKTYGIFPQVKLKIRYKKMVLPYDFEHCAQCNKIRNSHVLLTL